MGTIHVTDDEIVIENLDLVDVTLNIDPDGRKLTVRNNKITLTGGPVVNLHVHPRAGDSGLGMVIK